MKNKVMQILSEPRKSNSSFGKWALDAEVKHIYNSGATYDAVQVLHFWTKEKALEVKEGMLVNI